MKNQSKKTVTDSERKAYAIVGRHGGRASFKKRGKKVFSEMGKKGAKIRWDKIKNDRTRNK